MNELGDARKIYKDFNLKASGLLELADVARAYDPSSKSLGPYISLRTLVAFYLGKELDKGPVRLSDWEARLTEAQMICGLTANDGTRTALINGDRCGQ